MTIKDITLYQQNSRLNFDRPEKIAPLTDLQHTRIEQPPFGIFLFNTYQQPQVGIAKNIFLQV